MAIYQNIVTTWISQGENFTAFLFSNIFIVIQQVQYYHLRNENIFPLNSSKYEDCSIIWAK